MVGPPEHPAAVRSVPGRQALLPGDGAVLGRRTLRGDHEAQLLQRAGRVRDHQAGALGGRVLPREQHRAPVRAARDGAAT